MIRARRSRLRRQAGLLLGACLVLAPLPGRAEGEPASAWAAPAPADDAGQAAHLHSLYRQLRCLVCQNGSLADSQAPLALDLKREIARRVAAGEPDERIIDFLAQRYGDTIRYQPPWRPRTWLLWLAPALLLAGGAAWLLRQRRPASPLEGRPAGDMPDAPDLFDPPDRTAP